MLHTVWWKESIRAHIRGAAQNSREQRRSWRAAGAGGLQRPTGSASVLRTRCPSCDPNRVITNAILYSVYVYGMGRGGTVLYSQFLSNKTFSCSYTTRMVQAEHFQLSVRITRTEFVCCAMQTWRVRASQHEPATRYAACAPGNSRLNAVEAFAVARPTTSRCSHGSNRWQQRSRHSLDLFGFE